MQRHPYDDPDFEFTPLRPASASATPASMVSPNPAPASAPAPAPAPAATPPSSTWPSLTPATPTTSASIAGESASPGGPTASSSGRARGGGRLAGVAVVSILSAAIASVATVGALVATGPVADPTAAATANTPESVTLNGADAVVAVAETASPAVVTITTESAGSDFGPYSMPSTGVGSGFVFDASGLILTNNHVVEGGDSFTVTFQDDTELPGRVVATDPKKDLAVVKVEGSGLPTIEIGDSASLKVGQMTVAIGSPLGTFTESVTAGILSAVDRSIEVSDPGRMSSSSLTGLLQTDTAINPGNSGGPLLDSTGRAIGVNVAGTMGAEGIGFAVPIDAAAEIMAEARGESGGAGGA